MRIAIGCDHRGRDVKPQVIRTLTAAGHDVVEMGPDASQSIDYPDVAAMVAGEVSRGAAQRGVLICGTGIGMAIAANKFPGVRAVPLRDPATADICRRHNDCNLLCLPGDLGGEMLETTVKTWLETPFEGGRHQRRLDKISAIENKQSTC